MMRQELSEWMRNNKDLDTENTRKVLTDPEVQADLLVHMKKLQNKKSKKWHLLSFFNEKFYVKDLNKFHEVNLAIIDVSGTWAVC